MGGGWSVKNLDFLNFVVHCILRGDIFFWRRKKEKEKEENVWRRKMYFFWRRRKREMEKEENMTEKENISTMDGWTEGRKIHRRFYKGPKKSTTRISKPLMLLFLAP